MSFRHNLYAHYRSRNPFAGSYRDQANHCDWRNNVVYNGGDQAMIFQSGNLFDGTNNGVRDGLDQGWAVFANYHEKARSSVRLPKSAACSMEGDRTEP